MSPVLAPPPSHDGLTGRPRTPSTVTFSVCLAAYQVAPYIGGAIDSLLAQTLAPHEIIVCDDGSTDDLDAALAPYADRVAVVHQQNRGLAAARNAAIRLASGEFVAILDPDDLYLPTRLERLAALAAARPDLDILTTDAFIEMDGEAVGRYYAGDNRFVVDDQRAGILHANFVFGLAAVRRTTLAAAGGYDESVPVAEDWDCWIRLILSGARAGLVDEPLAIYRMRSGSLSGTRANLLRGRVDVLQRALGRGDLDDHERASADRALQFASRMLALVEAHDAVVQGAPDARARCFRIARASGFPWRSRVKVALCALAPRSAASVLRAREARRRRDPRAVRAARE